MADENYDMLIKEIDGLNPNIEDSSERESTIERMLEIQKELSGAAYADRNDDHQLAYLGLQDKANAMIEYLSGKSFDDISVEQISVYESLLANFASHIGNEYSSTAAELKNKLDSRRETLEANSPSEQSPVKDEPTDEITPTGAANGENAEEDNDIKETVLDEEQQSFLDSINENNKEQIIERYNKIDAAADEIGDVFAAPTDENAEDKFKGLRNFYDNVWIDRDVPDDENAKAGEDDLKKRQQLKDRIKEMATIMAIKDLVQDPSVDSLTSEQMKERMKDAVRDNMEFLTYNLVANQSSFKILEAGQDLTKLSPEQKKEHISQLQSGYKEVFSNLDNVLSGQSNTPISIGSPAINATMVPQYKEAKKFAKDFQKKTGIKKLFNRVKDFDAKMTKDHHRLWRFAKTTAISALTGPVGMMAYTGYNLAKQTKEMVKEYKELKQKEGGEDLTIRKFLGQNKGKIASMVVSAGFSAYSGIDGIDFGNIGQSLAKNTGLIGNMTGSLLSGDALNNVSQNLSWDSIKNAANSMADKISAVGNIDISQVWDGLKNSYSPTKLTRVALSGLGVGLAKASDAYSKAGDGNKWKAARKAFTTHLTATLTGMALADSLTVVNGISNQATIEAQKIEIAQQDLQSIQASLGIGLDTHAIHIGDPNSGVHIGIEADKLDDIKIPEHQHTDTSHIPSHHQETVIHKEEVKVQENDNNQEIKAEPEKTVEMKVNGENVEAKLGDTLEKTLDNARKQYLQNNPEIDINNNTVNIEAEGGNATIETKTDDIMKGEAVIGQEAEIHREIHTQEADIKDDIKEITTDTGQAKLMESEGRNDIDTNNNIPDGARILNVTEFHNENQDLRFTEYEQDGKVYITDGNHTRLAPEGQSAEQRYQTWNNMLRETAAAGYDDTGAVIASTQNNTDNAVNKDAINLNNETTLDKSNSSTEDIPPANNDGNNNGEHKLSLAEQLARLRNGQSLSGNNNGDDASGSYEDFVAKVRAGYDQNNSTVLQDTENFKNDIQNKVDNSVDQVLEDHNRFLAEKADYEQNGYKGFQDYSSQVDKLGLSNSEVLSQSQHTGTRSHSIGAESASYQTFEQTEFRQGSNGFALMHNNEIRSVTTDDKGNLQFQITENNQTRLMTRDEANRFCNEIKTQGLNSENFNNRLFKTIEDTKHIGDARGLIKYGTEPRVVSNDARTNNMVMQNQSGRKI
ncbi:MAG: hypothetical protein IJ532_06110 [Alphaproteobacteria bacterium]|nr:hypothetical protein [Alphaproteobacteria bacterium]